MNQCVSRLYNKREFIKTLNLASHSIVKFRRYLALIDKPFETNIMLAVTEVNGCQICSYYHTKKAIDSGISKEALTSLLSGSHTYVKPEEAQALLFAQHYAFKKGLYSKETFNRVIEYYGEEIAYGILATTRLISFGNAYGINLGNFKSRFTKVGRIKGSKLINELFVIVSPVILFPLTLLINLFIKKKI